MSAAETAAAPARSRTDRLELFGPVIAAVLVTNLLAAGLAWAVGQRIEASEPPAAEVALSSQR